MQIPVWAPRKFQRGGRLEGNCHAENNLAPSEIWFPVSLEKKSESDSTLDGTGAPLPGHALWLDTSANRGKWSGDDRASGFSDNHTQVAVGFELLADQPHRFGIGFSHSLAGLSDEARRGKSQEEGVNLGARMNF